MSTPTPRSIVQSIIATIAIVLGALGLHAAARYLTKGQQEKEKNIEEQ